MTTNNHPNRNKLDAAMRTIERQALLIEDLRKAILEIDGEARDDCAMLTILSATKKALTLIEKRCAGDKP